MTAHEREGTDPLARIVFAVLIVACLAAFFITQRLKHTPTAVQKFQLAGHFSPYAPAGGNEEPISFKLAKAESVTVTVVNSAGHTVATLLNDHPVARYKQFSLRWNGREGFAHGYSQFKSPGGRTIVVADTHGRIAPAGEYQVNVTLLGQSGRVVPSPREFTLEGPAAAK